MLGNRHYELRAGLRKEDVDQVGPTAEARCDLLGSLEGAFVVGPLADGLK